MTQHHQIKNPNKLLKQQRVENSPPFETTLFPIFPTVSLGRCRAMDRAMKVFLLMLVGICLALLVACDAGSSYVTKKLPSGREVRILSTGRIYSTKEEAWIIRLRYETDLSLDNPLGLQPEVDDIWGQFRVDADQSGLRHAVVTAVEPYRFRDTKFHRQFGFLYIKDENGVWRLRTASQQPTPSLKPDVAKATQP